MHAPAQLSLSRLTPAAAALAPGARARQRLAVWPLVAKASRAPSRTRTGRSGHVAAMDSWCRLRAGLVPARAVAASVPRRAVAARTREAHARDGSCRRRWLAGKAVLLPSALAASAFSPSWLGACGGCELHLQNDSWQKLQKSCEKCFFSKRSSFSHKASLFWHRGYFGLGNRHVPDRNRIFCSKKLARDERGSFFCFKFQVAALSRGQYGSP